LIPVIADDLGVIGVGGIGASVDRICSDMSGITITIKQIKE
jgi:lactate dehydrogenase-like 2-hydroxyacid dehydrogenase